MALRTMLVMVALQAGQTSAVNPIQKVLELISNLQAKIIAEGESEQKLYDEKANFCQKNVQQKNFEIKTGKSEVGSLEATIDEQNAAITAATTKIDELSADIGSNEEDLKQATSVREKETADYKAEEAESLEVINSLDGAIGILTKEMAGAGVSTLQLKSAKGITEALTVLVQGSAISTAEASKLTALVQQNSETNDDDGDYGAAFGAPAAAVTEGHSDGIMSVLEGLLDKAESQLDKARKAEASSLHSFSMVKQSLTDELTYAKKDLVAAKKSVAEAQEKVSVAKGDLEATSKDLDSDIAAKASLHHECMTAATEYEVSTKARGEELDAVVKAQKVITESTTGSATQAQVSLLQLSSNSAHYHAVSMIRELAKTHHSSSLAELASRMASAVRLGGTSGREPFKKVKSLIGDMLKKLEGEASEEATQKAYCDKEMKETSEKKDEKSAEMESLETKLEQKKAASAKLKEEVATLQSELADMSSAIADATQLRLKEKEAYEKSKPDLEQGLKGVKTGLKILMEYYAKDGDSSTKSAGSDGSSDGIIGFLEVIESDLTKGLNELEAAEETAAAEYKKFDQANELEKIAKEKDENHKTKEYKTLDKDITELSGDLSGLSDENDAILEYDAKIKKTCIATPEPYAEKKARREAEIAGLKEALAALEEDSAGALIQKSSKVTLRGATNQKALGRH
jgi:hypothetical protein